MSPKKAKSPLSHSETNDFGVSLTTGQAEESDLLHVTGTLLELVQPPAVASMCSSMTGSSLLTNKRVFYFLALYI